MASPPHTKAEALARRLRSRCAKTFGQVEYKRDKTGAVKASERAKMDVYHGVKEIEVSSAHALGLLGRRPHEPDLPGAWVFTVIGKGAPRGDVHTYEGMAPFRYREDLWRVNVYVTKTLDIFYGVTSGKPPRNIESMLACAIGPDN